MKRLLILLLPFCLISCKDKISEKKTAIIDLALHTHAMNISSGYDIDSLREETEFRLRHVLIVPDDSLSYYTKVHMDTFSSQWNKPYDVKKDRELTFVKYMEFCHANGFDPETYYQFIE